MNLELLYVNSPYDCEPGNAVTTQTTRITRLFFCGADCLGKTIIGGENAELKMLFLCGRSVCCKVLCQIGDWVGRDGETVRVKRYSR